MPGQRGGGGVGYGAAGTIHGSGERDYHYGATPQALLELRLILGDRAMLNLTAHEYYVSGLGSTESRGSENVARGTASFTVRGRNSWNSGSAISRRLPYPPAPAPHPADAAPDLCP